MNAKNIYNTVWRFLPINPNDRNQLLGEPVQAGQPILIEHCATSHYLSSDKIDYRNDFGTECEISVHSAATHNKSQALNLEKVGKITRDQPTKF